MNTDTTPPSLPPISNESFDLLDPDYAPIEGNSFSHILNQLLKKPLSIIYEINNSNGNKDLNQGRQKSVSTTLLIITLISLSIFGVVLGMFSGGHQLWAAPLKLTAGVFFSALICLPSLYIFSSLGGMDAKVQHIVGIMLTVLAITSLLLVGFAPVIWLFSTSSNSTFFFGSLAIIVWLLSLVFGLRILTRASKSMGGSKTAHLRVWSIIFTLVTLQMTTTIRPIIGSSEHFFNTEEKSFFLAYWLKSASQGKPQSNATNDAYSR
ncbi:MAG: hypothetical protein ACSHX0_10330 [Akkermansiaceae bacterium]